MRHLNETFTDDEFEALAAQKDGRSWRETILDQFGVEIDEDDDDE